MICLDSSRNIIQDTDYIENDLSEKEFLVVDDWDNGEYHFEPYQSDRLVYLGEHDLCYSIYDLEKGLLTRSPYKTRPGMIQSWITTQLTLEIPHLKKLVKNQWVKGKYVPEKIKERDNYTCQLCGENDVRVLNVHHIVPRKSPFITKDFIHSPLNQITLCANCHRIEHHILRYGNGDERKEHVKRMLCINGFNWTRYTNSAYYMPIKDIEKWNKIEFL